MTSMRTRSPRAFLQHAGQHKCPRSCIHMRGIHMPCCVCSLVSALGQWCSGITSAPHAEGPGLKSQCVHWRSMSAAAAAAEIQRKLLRPCFALSCFFHCQCHLFCARPFYSPRLASGRRSSRRTSRSSCYRKHACQAAAHSSACFTLLMKTVLLLRGRVTHGARSRHGLRCRSASDSW